MCSLHLPTVYSLEACNQAQLFRLLKCFISVTAQIASSRDAPGVPAYNAYKTCSSCDRRKETNFDAAIRTYYA